MTKTQRSNFLREIMTRAHAIRRETGADMSTALKAAWKAERIEEIEGQIFMLNMADRWAREDYMLNDALNAKLRELQAA